MNKKNTLLIFLLILILPMVSSAYTYGYSFTFGGPDSIDHQQEGFHTLIIDTNNFSTVRTIYLVAENNMCFSPSTHSQTTTFHIVSGGSGNSGTVTYTRKNGVDSAHGGVTIEWDFASDTIVTSSPLTISYEAAILDAVKACNGQYGTSAEYSVGAAEDIGIAKPVAWGGDIHPKLPLRGTWDGTTFPPQADFTYTAVMVEKETNPITRPTIPNPTNSHSNTSVSLHGDKTDVVLGEDIILKLSAVSLITKPKMHVQVIIIPPSGMSVTSSEFSKSGAGQFTSNYELEPGDGKDIEVRIKSNQVGDFNVNGRIVYYFGDEKDKGEDYTLNLPVKVRISSTTTQTPTTTPTPKNTGFGVIISITGLLVTILLKRKR